MSIYVLVNDKKDCGVRHGVPFNSMFHPKLAIFCQVLKLILQNAVIQHSIYDEPNKNSEIFGNQVRGLRRIGLHCFFACHFAKTMKTMQ